MMILPANNNSSSSNASTGTNTTASATGGGGGYTRSLILESEVNFWKAKTQRLEQDLKKINLQKQGYHDELLSMQNLAQQHQGKLMAMASGATSDDDSSTVVGRRSSNASSSSCSGEYTTNLQADMERLAEKLMQEADKRSEAELAKLRLETELEELTKTLFEEANLMVVQERRKVAELEQEYRDLQAHTKEITSMLKSYQRQCFDLRAKLNHRNLDQLESIITTNNDSRVKFADDLTTPTLNKPVSDALAKLQSHSSDPMVVSRSSSTRVASSAAATDNDNDNDRGKLSHYLAHRASVCGVPSPAATAAAAKECDDILASLNSLTNGSGNSSQTRLKKNLAHHRASVCVIPSSSTSTSAATAVAAPKETDEFLEKLQSQGNTTATNSSGHANRTRTNLAHRASVCVIPSSAARGNHQDDDDDDDTLLAKLQTHSDSMAAAASDQTSSANRTNLKKLAHRASVCVASVVPTTHTPSTTTTTTATKEKFWTKAKGYFSSSTRRSRSSMIIP